MKLSCSGKFSRVLLCQHESSKDYVALKLMVLEDIVRYKQVTHVENEKKILNRIKHPFIVKMISCSIDTRFLYFVLPFIQGGELFSHLRALGKFRKASLITRKNHLILRTIIVVTWLSSTLLR